MADDYFYVRADEDPFLSADDPFYVHEPCVFCDLETHGGPQVRVPRLQGWAHPECADEDQRATDQQYEQWSLTP